MKFHYTTIPVKLCEYALVNRKVNHLMLYLYLKHTSGGHIRYSGGAYKRWAKDLKKSERWTKDAITWLIKKGWITVNSKRQSYRIISYEQLHRKLKLDSNAAVIYELENWTELKNFCCAAVITYYMKVKRYNERKGGSVSNIGDASKSKYFFPKGFYAMPISYLAKSIGVSNSTADNYKKCAALSNYLEVKNNYSYFVDDQRVNITGKDLPFIRKAYPNIAGRLRVNKKGEVMVVEADIMRSEIKGRKKRFK